ncbi:MAG: 3-deoxy-8-phosphooctulonate synthase [Leptospiraceae bacterium]|nr:3-deoxy-8-phosphooctulonate synthase [Leptospiraceae bacterium]MDW8307086.1 3-deoxy-8-phosphooctulonate synthase [Leptospiraceae bacterium]
MSGLTLTPEREFLGTKIGGKNPFFLIAGPCVIENEELLDVVAQKLKELSQKWGLLIVFKSSYDKANRSSIRSYRGPGLEEGLKLLAQVKKKYGLPLLTDVHWPHEVEKAAEVVDVLQIPAFLCRQTDLLIEAARSGRWTNVKKGQFIAPLDALQILDKFYQVGTDKVFLCERGYSFGYNNLIVDMRNFELLRRHKVHMVFDATHSTQLPGGGEVSGGQREMAFPLARAACAAGVDGLFFEVHPNPPEAKSDATNQIYLSWLEGIIEKLLSIDALVKERIHANS